MADVKTIKSFSVRVFPHQQLSAESVADFNGVGSLWQDYQYIKLPGFDGSQTVNLTDFWRAVFVHQPLHYQCDVIGCETIVKWSDTRTLKEKFTLIAEIVYE